MEEELQKESQVPRKKKQSKASEEEEVGSLLFIVVPRHQMAPQLSWTFYL